MLDVLRHARRNSGKSDSYSSFLLRAILLAACLLSTSCGWISPELKNRIARAKQAAGADEPVQVIVQQWQTQTEVHRQRVGDLGGTHERHLHLIQSSVLKLPLSAVEKLAADGYVVNVFPDRTLEQYARFEVAFSLPGIDARFQTKAKPAWTSPGGSAGINSVAGSWNELRKTVGFPAIQPATDSRPRFRGSEIHGFSL